MQSDRWSQHSIKFIGNTVDPQARRSVAIMVVQRPLLPEPKLIEVFSDESICLCLVMITARMRSISTGPRDVLMWLVNINHSLIQQQSKYFPEFLT